MTHFAPTPAIRPATTADTAQLAALFHASIHRVCRRDYSAAQLAAWSPAPPAATVWAGRLATRTTVLAEVAGDIAGFGELEADGHIDGFYCHPDFQGRGVGSAILRALEREARGRALHRLFVEASITARPFFAARGFRLVREQSVARRGVRLTNYAMEKAL